MCQCRIPWHDVVGPDPCVANGQNPTTGLLMSAVSALKGGCETRDEQGREVGLNENRVQENSGGGCELDGPLSPIGLVPLSFVCRIATMAAGCLHLHTCAYVMPP